MLKFGLQNFQLMRSVPWYSKSACRKKNLIEGNARIGIPSSANLRQITDSGCRQRIYFCTRIISFGLKDYIKGRSWPTLRMLFLIFVISGEKLFLNVADDSAQTLSVLGNMGGVLDDCGLSFVQKCRRSPQKYPQFWSPTDFSKYYRKRTPTEIIPNR